MALSAKEKRAIATLVRWKVEGVLIDFRDDFEGEADRLPPGVLVHATLEDAQDYVQNLLDRLPRGLTDAELEE